MSEANLNAYALAQGIDKTTKEMTESEKAILRYNFILENTAIAQGDVARSSDSFANTQRSLELTIKDIGSAFGNEMLPSLTNFMGGIKEFLESTKGVVTFIGSAINFVIDCFNLCIAIYNALPAPIRKVTEFIYNAGTAILNTVDIIINESIDALNRLSGNTKDTSKDMGYYMQDFAQLTEESMSEAAKSVDEAFADTAESIKGELGVVGDALKKYYDNDLKEYEKSLEKKWGSSKAAQVKIATEVEKRKQMNEQAYIKDMAMYEKKANSEIAAEQAKVEAYKRQQKTVDETYEKELNWIDKIKKAWSDAFNGSAVQKQYNSFSGRSEFVGGRSMLAGAYANTYSTSNQTANNTYNMTLYGADFVTAMNQAQSMNRLRG